MRRARIWAAALACAGGVCSATAQESAPPDVPAGEATIEGRVVDEQRAGVADVGVILYSLLPDGEPGLRQTRSDAAGGFRFERISGDPQVVYLVGTRVGGVPFGARATFEAGQTLRRVEVEVAQPSRDVSSVRELEPQLRLERGCSHVRVHHQHALRNPTSRVVFVPLEGRAETAPVFELTLPEGATDIETPMGIASDGFSRSGRTLRYFGPVYPGDSNVEFSYGIPLTAGGSLRIGFPDGAPAARVLVPSRGARAQGEGLRDAGETPLPLGEMAGPHRALRSGPIAAGGALELQVVWDDSAAPAALTLTEARLWLELDDAALDVSEVYQLRVEGEAALEAASAPLLCIALPSGAESLRFSNASLDMGLSRDPEGALAVSGPIPAGDSSLSLRYRLPVAPGPVSFEREFLSDVDLLTVLVADTGIVPAAERLHRRRPIRSEDRSYLHLEGFGIASGERVPIELRRLSGRGSLPLASSGFVLLMAVCALFYLIAPLRSDALAEAADPPASGISREREALYASIDALDEDFETGKLSAEDHERMRAELRARAVALLQQERAREAGQRAPVAGPPTPPDCPGCGATPELHARFCSQCGTPLRPGEPKAT